MVEVSWEYLTSIYNWKKNSLYIIIDRVVSYFRAVPNPHDTPLNLQDFACSSLEKWWKNIFFEFRKSRTIQLLYWRWKFSLIWKCKKKNRKLKIFKWSFPGNHSPFLPVPSRSFPFLPVPPHLPTTEKSIKDKNRFSTTKTDNTALNSTPTLFNIVPTKSM